MAAEPDVTERRRGAVFFDRDGTLIEDEHYLADPDRVRLRPGAAAAVHRVRTAGLAAVVVTNQSGIGRGLFGEAEYEAVRARLDDLLAGAGAQLDATYHCPHAPDIEPPCACRKPGRALFERAAAELGLDLARSGAIGDRVRDLTPVVRLGGYGVLVPSPDTPLAEMTRARDEYALATTLDAAVDRVLARIAARGGGADGVDIP